MFRNQVRQQLCTLDRTPWALERLARCDGPRQRLQPAAAALAAVRLLQRSHGGSACCLHWADLYSDVQYDTDVVTWSPQGRIHQIEYAMEAVKQGSAAVGLKVIPELQSALMLRQASHWVCSP